MVERILGKDKARVRFPVAAPYKRSTPFTFRKTYDIITEKIRKGEAK